MLIHHQYYVLVSHKTLIQDKVSVVEVVNRDTR